MGSLAPDIVPKSRPSKLEGLVAEKKGPGPKK